MRRFQCIKTMDDAFTQGTPYQEVEKPDGYTPVTVLSVYLINNFGEIVELTPFYMKGYFQEMPGDELIDDPYRDYEAEEYTLLTERGGFAKGFLWAVVITAAIVILYAIFA